MLERTLNRGYKLFKRHRLSRSPTVVRLARGVRDVLFLIKVLKDGVRGQRVVETDVLDGRLYVDLADSGVSRTLYLNGIYEPDLTRACPDLVGDGETVVDVGANIGYFTVLFSESVGENGSVYAFEPDPRNFDLLERNVTLRECRNVTTERVAISDIEGTLEFELSDDQFSRSNADGLTDTGGEVAEVAAVTLDDRIDDTVDLLKVDVVGAELRVLRGALSLIERYRPTIVLPHLPEKWENTELTVFDRIESMGYRRESLDGEDLGWDVEVVDERREPTRNVVLRPPPTGDDPDPDQGLS